MSKFVVMPTVSSRLLYSVKQLPHAPIVQSDKATQKGSLESFKALFEEESRLFSSFLETFLTLGVK